eukprot:364353-Chlamydomonas_euryale.AAC.8
MQPLRQRQRRAAAAAAVAMAWAALAAACLVDSNQWLHQWLSAGCDARISTATAHSTALRCCRGSMTLFASAAAAETGRHIDCEVLPRAHTIKGFACPGG